MSQSLQKAELPEKGVVSSVGWFTDAFSARHGGFVGVVLIDGRTGGSGR